MNRVKFLVFALVTAGLWAYHVVVSGAAVVKATEQATTSVVGAGAAVALRIEAQRSELEAALVQLAASPAAWNLPAHPQAKDGLGVDRFNAVRQVLASVLSDANKPALVVALVSEQSSLMALGAADPTVAPQGFDLTAAAQGGAAGSIVSFGDLPYIFFATPLLAVDRNEVRVAGQAVAGLPVLPDAKRLEAVARELKLSTLAVVSQNKVLVAAGTEKVQAEPALKLLKAGQVTPMGVGPVRQLGPLGLPMFVEGLAHSMGSRQVLAGTPFEVVSVVSVREPLDALASYQLFGIFGLLGIILLAVLVGLLIKAEDDGGTRMSLPPPLPMPPPKREEPQPVPLMGAASHGPEGSPDDFHFPASAVSAVRAKDVLASFPTPSAPQPAPAGPPVLATQPAPSSPVPEASPMWFGGPPEQDPFASAAPAPIASRPSSPGFSFSPTPSSPSSGGPFNDSGAENRGVVYPTFAPGGDPFAGSGPMDQESAANDDSPDATRVAVVPMELIKATRPGGSTGYSAERPAAKVSSEGMPRVQSVAPADPEEKHYQEVFRDFVSTREKCGEPADGLTYERFKAKLLKNRDQLMSKYQCRTVRFQVYVKEGKAALKATPVKE